MSRHCVRKADQGTQYVPMDVFARRRCLGLAFILLLTSAEAIRVRSTIDTTRGCTGGGRDAPARAGSDQRAVEAENRWTNSELIQLKGQVKSLSLHLGLLKDEWEVQSVAGIKEYVMRDAGGAQLQGHVLEDS